MDQLRVVWSYHFDESPLFFLDDAPLAYNHNLIFLSHGVDFLVFLDEPDDFNVIALVDLLSALDDGSLWHRSV